MTTTLTFTAALIQAEAQARSTLPTELHERLSAAVALVKDGSVLQADDGATWLVASTSRPGAQHQVNGTCPCEDAHYRAPRGLCKHRLSVYLARRTLQLLGAPQPLVVPEGPPPDLRPTGAESTPEVDHGSTPLPQGIDPRHVVTIQGKPFVKFAGLLELAHKRGLQSLSVDWTHNDAELSLAHAVAVFPFGTFAESGDASPANVNKKVAPHFRRCALTRAAARCLRIALGLEMVSVEELADD